MKKALPIVAVLLVLGAVAFVYFQKRQALTRVRATALAPVDTLVFIHLPDVRQTAIRWPKTQLAQIGDEPEMQAFLEKPMQKLGWMSSTRARMEQLTHAAPREAFAAITSFEGNTTPRFVAGFSFSGSRTAVEELLSESRTAMRNTWPAGKADIVTYAGAEIETYTEKDQVIAETIRDGWYLISNQLDLLEKTLDRLDAKPGSDPSVTNAELFQRSMAPLPADADAVLYARLDTLADKLAPLLASAGQTITPEQLGEIRKTKALSAAVKLDGEQLRDMLFILNEGGGPGTPLARRGMDLSSPDTLLYYTSSMSEKVEIAPETLAPLALVIPGLATLEQSLASKGLKLSDVGSIFGPEFSVLLGWPQADAQPSVMLGFDVRDSVKARQFMEAAIAMEVGGQAWNKREEGDALIYSSPAQGMIPGPSFALAQNFMILGFSDQTVSAGIQKLRTKEASLAGTAEFEAQAKKVAVPTSAFGYLDTRRVFERIYGIAKPFVAMSLAFSPDAGQYIDAGKLPNTDTIAKHLTPSVYSQTTTAEGTIIESAGTLTFNQALIGVVGGSIAAALPTLKQTLPNLQGMPGLTLPGAPQVVPADPTANPAVTPPAKAPATDAPPKAGPDAAASGDGQTNSSAPKTPEAGQ